MRRLLEPFGPLKRFKLLRDSSNKSRGTFVFEFEDAEVTSGALAALHGTSLGEFTKLSFQRVAPDLAHTLFNEKPAATAAALAKAADEASAAAEAATPSQVLRLSGMVGAQELASAQEVKEITEDVEEEAARFGAVEAVLVPGLGQPGSGAVFVAFAAVGSAAEARKVMDGREFGDTVVTATFFPLARFADGDLGECLFGDASGDASGDSEALYAGATEAEASTAPATMIIPPAPGSDLD